MIGKNFEPRNVVKPRDSFRLLGSAVSHKCRNTPLRKASCGLVTRSKTSLLRVWERNWSCEFRHRGYCGRETGVSRRRWSRKRTYIYIYIYNLAKRISVWVGSHALTCPQIGPTPNSSSPTN
jgi:hypothetical protein